MKLDVRNATNASVGKVDLPAQFHEPVRADLIKRAVESLWSNLRQPYGAFERAGKQHAAKLSRRRRDYKTSYGIGISRVPRKIMSHRGTRFNWVGAFAPGMVGGRRAHPPKAEKQWAKKINISERRKAICAALTATMEKHWVEQRGHRVPQAYPFLLDSSVEQLAKTKEVLGLLEQLGFSDELARVSQVKLRPGRGKMRGRAYRVRRGPLFVVSKSCPLVQSARNILGVEVSVVDRVNAELLAPGANPGRLTLFTQAAIDRLAKEKLFTREHQAKPTPTEKPKEKPKVVKTKSK